MFVHYNGKIINAENINYVVCDDFSKSGIVTVGYTKNTMVDGSDQFEIVKGAEAVNLIMALCPAVLEGKRAKYQRHAWAIHNLIGHPLMQICSWLKLPALGIKIHDATVPEPKIEE